VGVALDVGDDALGLDMEAEDEARAEAEIEVWTDVISELEAVVETKVDLAVEEELRDVVTGNPTEADTPTTALSLKIPPAFEQQLPLSSAPQHHVPSGQS
jgi:hypothetical protein